MTTHDIIILALALGLFVGGLAWMIISGEKAMRRREKELSEIRRANEKKMFEARMRGEIYIPQPGKLQ